LLALAPGYLPGPVDDFTNLLHREIIKRGQIKYYHIKSNMSMLGACCSGRTPPPAQLSDAMPEAWSSGVAGASALAFNWFCHDERSSRVIAVKILPLRALSLFILTHMRVL